MISPIYEYQFIILIQTTNDEIFVFRYFLTTLIRQLSLPISKFEI